MEGDFYTLDGYKNLSDFEKCQLHAEAAQKLKTWYGCEHPFLEDCQLGCLVDLVEQYTKEYPNADIYGLGQSPAYLIEAMRLSAEFHGTRVKRRYEKIAFSGKWHELVDGEYKLQTAPCWLKFFVSQAPTHDDFETYKIYLSSFLPSPREIVGRYEKNGKKIVIVDYSESGESLASFADVLKQWFWDSSIEGETVKNIVSFLIFYRPASDACNQHIQDACSPFRSNIYTLDEHMSQSSFLGRLANSDCYDDRLVPYYPFKRWKKQDPRDFQLSRNAELCLFLLTDYIQQAKESNV